MSETNTGGWARLAASSPANCRGLDYLTSIDQLLVHQEVEMFEANKFTVKNSQGQKLFDAVEQSDCCVRCCFGSSRPFGMMILDNYKNEVIHLERPVGHSSCWCPGNLQKMEVYAPPGCLAGSVEQEWSILQSIFSVKNSAGDTVMRIEGPGFTFSFGNDVEFNVYSQEGLTQVGRISKQWSGLMREAFTNADNFRITFPMDMNVKMKAVMLGACFLIDAMFFDESGNQ